MSPPQDGRGAFTVRVHSASRSSQPSPESVSGPDRAKVGVSTLREAPTDARVLRHGCDGIIAAPDATKPGRGPQVGGLRGVTGRRPRPRLGGAGCRPSRTCRHPAWMRRAGRRPHRAHRWVRAPHCYPTLTRSRAEVPSGSRRRGWRARKAPQGTWPRPPVRTSSSGHLGSAPRCVGGASRVFSTSTLDARLQETVPLRPKRSSGEPPGWTGFAGAAVVSPCARRPAKCRLVSGVGPCRTTNAFP